MPRAVDGWKKCSKCGVTKEATRENYPPHRQTADRFDSRCRECMRPLHRARMRAILATPEGQAYEAARNATPERKAYMATYNDAPERKADARVRMRNYRATPEGMAYNEFIKGPRLDDLRARLVYVMDEVFHTDAQRRKFICALVDRGLISNPDIRSVLHHRSFDYVYVAPFYQHAA